MRFNTDVEYAYKNREHVHMITKNTHKIKNTN